MYDISCLHHTEKFVRGRSSFALKIVCLVIFQSTNRHLKAIYDKKVKHFYMHYYLTNPLRVVLFLWHFEDEETKWEISPNLDPGVSDVKHLLNCCLIPFCSGENEDQNNYSTRALGFLPCRVLDPSNIVSLIWNLSCQINLCISNSDWHWEGLTPCAANWMGSGGQGWCLKMILATSVDTSRGVCQLHGFSGGINVQDSGAQSSLTAILVPPGSVSCKVSIKASKRKQCTWEPINSLLPSESWCS